MKTKVCIAIFISILFLLFENHVKAQYSVGVGTLHPDTSAMLELRSSKKGLLPTRVFLQSGTDNATIVLPATGLLVYNTNQLLSGANGSGTGYYYNKGTPSAPEWIRLNTVEGQVNAPRTIWGVVDRSGNIITGSGDFSVIHVEEGKYEITFNIPFNNYPSCITNQYLREPPLPYLSSWEWPSPKDNSGVAGVTTSKALVWTCDDSYSYRNRPFAFSCTGF